MMPTAMARLNSTASMSGRSSTRLITKIAPVSTPATQQQGELAQPDLELGVRLPLAQPDRDPPELRRPPVATTTPMPEPAAPPCPSAHRTRVRPAAARRHRLGGLLHRDRLTGQDRLLTLQVRRLEQAQVGGHYLTELQVHDVAGHQVGHVDLARMPVAEHHGAVMDLACRAAPAFGACTR